MKFPVFLKHSGHGGGPYRTLTSILERIYIFCFTFSIEGLKILILIPLKTIVSSSVSCFFIPDWFDVFG